jgi:hypothetical protein
MCVQTIANLADVCCTHMAASSKQINHRDSVGTCVQFVLNTLEFFAGYSKQVTFKPLNEHCVCEQPQAQCRPSDCAQYDLSSCYHARNDSSPKDTQDSEDQSSHERKTGVTLLRIAAFISAPPCALQQSILCRGTQV